MHSKPGEEETSGPTFENVLMSNAKKGLPVSTEDASSLIITAPPSNVRTMIAVLMGNVWLENIKQKKLSALLSDLLPLKEDATMPSTKGARLRSLFKTPVASTKKLVKISITPVPVMLAKTNNIRSNSSTQSPVLVLLESAMKMMIA